MSQGGLPDRRKKAISVRRLSVWMELGLLWKERQTNRSYFRKESKYSLALCSKI